MMLPTILTAITLPEHQEDPEIRTLGENFFVMLRNKMVVMPRPVKENNDTVNDVCSYV